MEPQKQPQIKVFEEVSIARKIVAAVAGPTVFLVVFFGVVIYVPTPEYSQILTALVLLLGGSIGGCFLVEALIMFARRERVQVTPILAISENSTYWDTPVGGFILIWYFGLVFGSIIKSFARKSKFLLSEEGIVFYRLTGPTVVRWNKLKAFKADRDSNLFLLKRGIGNWLSLICTQQFEEAIKIISEHVPAK